jgi:hypothetical protein
MKREQETRKKIKGGVMKHRDLETGRKSYVLIGS